LFSSALISLLVNLFVSRFTQYTALPIPQNIGGKVAYGPWKKPLDFVGNPDHITLGLG